MTESSIGKEKKEKKKRLETEEKLEKKTVENRRKIGKKNDLKGRKNWKLFQFVSFFCRKSFMNNGVDSSNCSRRIFGLENISSDGNAFAAGFQ